MPELETLSDEALMTWIVNALMEAQRRGLTTVMLAEPAQPDADEAEAADEGESAQLLH